ncbi:MAG: substrate-binding domain-containing protein [bacterium]|nr:substrate-binding domain-containing protein [bacterium]
MKKLLTVLCVTLVVAALLVPAVSAADKEFKFAYVCKMLTHPWFIEEENGIKARTEKLGLDYVGVDGNLDDETFLQGVDNVIGQGADALMVVVTNQALGPVVVEKAQEAGIPVMTIDDVIHDSDGNQIPHVGLPTTATGEMGGHALAKLAEERGFFAEGNVVKVMQIDMSFLSVVHDRTVGYKAALMEDLPGLKDEDFLVQDSKTGMFEDNLPIASAILNSHPEVTHWIVTGINDDGAVAPLRIFEESGFPLENVLACGLGGYVTSYEEFQKEHNSYIVTKLQPFAEGEAAVQLLYDFLTEGKEPPQMSLISGVVVTKEDHGNYEWTF